MDSCLAANARRTATVQIIDVVGVMLMTNVCSHDRDRQIDCIDHLAIEIDLLQNVHVFRTNCKSHHLIVFAKGLMTAKPNISVVTAFA
jgi:hypothetical protein